MPRLGKAFRFHLQNVPAVVFRILLPSVEQDTRHHREWKDHQHRTVGVHWEHVAIRRNVLSGQLSTFPCIRSPSENDHLKYLYS